jgi:MFS family permease
MRPLPALDTEKWPKLLLDRTNFKGKLGAGKKTFFYRMNKVVNERESYDVYIERNRARNFTASTLVLAFFNLGLSFVFPATVMTTYASRLVDSAALIGLVPALFLVGMNLPQILYARTAELLARKHPLVMKLAVAERVPYLLIGLSILVFPQAPDELAFLILVLGVGIGSFSGGMLQPVWKSMLTKIIRPERRGRLFGIGFGVGGLLGVAGSVLVRMVISSFGSPQAFGVLFLLSFAAHSVSMLLFAITREPSKEPTTVTPPLAEYLRELPIVLKRDTNFTWYLVSQAFTILGLMGVGFYVLYAQDNFPIDEAFVGNMTMASLVGISLGTPVMGWLADRWGNKLLSVVSIGVSAAAPAVLLLAGSPLLLYLVFAFMNLGQNSSNIARIAITMEFSSVDKVPTITGLSGTLLAPFLLAAPIIAGSLIDGPGYPALFVTIFICQIAAAVLLVFRVKEPRARPKIL